MDIFFVLSGFLITGILYDTRNAAHRFKIFYMRRTLRIFPLYYGVLLLALLTTPIFHWLWNSSWLLWAAYLGNYVLYLLPTDPLVLGTGAFTELVAQPPFPFKFIIYTDHLWSLCVEEQFYLLWPLVVFFIKDRVKLRNLCAVLSVLCLVARIVCVHVLSPAVIRLDLLERSTPLRMDALLTGGFVALCLRGPESEKLHRLARPLLTLFTVGFIVFQFTCLEVSPEASFYRPDLVSPILTTYGQTLVDLFAALLIVVLLTPRGLLFRIFNLKWLRELGKVSYGFYIFHLMFLDLYVNLADRLTDHRGPSVQLTAAIALIATTLLSFASYRYYERPFLKLKRRFMVTPKELRET